MCICICQVISTTSGRWQRMWLSLITGWGWLATGTSGYQGRTIHKFCWLSLFSSSRSWAIISAPIYCHLFFREELETLSDSGINYIRIPVGYWTWQVSYWTWQLGKLVITHDNWLLDLAGLVITPGKLVIAPDNWLLHLAGWLMHLAGWLMHLTS